MPLRSAGAWLWARLTPPYTTPIPKYVVTWTRRFFRRGTLVDLLWKTLVLLVGGALVIAALSRGVAFVAAIAGIVLSFFIADDIQQTASDIWNRNFWRVG